MSKRRDAIDLRVARRRGDEMLGAVYEGQCPEHPGVWTAIRRVWPVGGQPSEGRVEAVKMCKKCAPS